MTKLPVAVVQAAPIPLDFQAGIDKALRLAREAIDSGARVVAFGETFLGGYPLWLDEAPGAALWDHPGTEALHAIMLEQAVVANDERLLPLQELADASGAAISFSLRCQFVNVDICVTLRVAGECAPCTGIFRRKLSSLRQGVKDSR